MGLKVLGRAARSRVWCQCHVVGMGQERHVCGFVSEDGEGGLLEVEAMAGKAD